MAILLTATAARATRFKSLHIPGTPLLLANIYDGHSARVLASWHNPQCKALATASWALAHISGKADEALTLPDQLSLLPPIAAVAAEFDLPLTADIQDGYAAAGDHNTLSKVIKQFITEFGIVGVNLEDSFHDRVGGEETVMNEDEAVKRVETVLRAARELGVEDFVVNARADSFLKGAKLEESIRRAKRYLRAGATTAFIFWPPKEEMLVEDVQRVIDELGGMVNVGCRLGRGITPADLARMGAARVSVGPQLYLATAKVREAAGGEEAIAEVLREKAGEVFGV